MTLTDRRPDWTTVLLLATGLAGAPLTQGPVRPPAGDVRAEAPRNDKGAVILEQKNVLVRFEKDGTGSRQLHLRVRLLTEDGVREWHLIPLTYAPESEELELLKLEVRKPDGTIVPVAPDAVPDVAVRPIAEATVFVDLRQKQVTVPAARPGDTIELSATWKVTRPLIPNHFWFGHSFTKDAIVESERLEIDLPADAVHVLKLREGAPSEAGDGRGVVANRHLVYRWHTANPKLPREHDAENGGDVVDDVRLTSFRAWEDVARWFYPVLNVPPDSTIRAKAAELTKGLTDRRQRIQAIYDYVSTEIRYVSLSFGLGRFVPHRPRDVLKNGYGDCKDKHGLLASLLAAIGVEAYPLLVKLNQERL